MNGVTLSEGTLARGDSLSRMIELPGCNLENDDVLNPPVDVGGKTSPDPSTPPNPSLMLLSFAPAPPAITGRNPGAQNSGQGRGAGGRSWGSLFSHYVRTFKARELYQRLLICFLS